MTASNSCSTNAQLFEKVPSHLPEDSGVPMAPGQETPERRRPIALSLMGDPLNLLNSPCRHLSPPPGTRWRRKYIPCNRGYHQSRPP